MWGFLKEQAQFKLKFNLQLIDNQLIKITFAILQFEVWEEFEIKKPE